MLASNTLQHALNAGLQHPCRVLGSDPVDYLISPRVLACMVAAPILNVMCFCMGEQRLTNHMITSTGE